MIRNGGAEALGILRGLIHKVTLTPADDHFAVEMKGAMEGMLALAQTDTGPVVLSLQGVPEFDKGGCGIFGLVAHHFVIEKEVRLPQVIYQ